MHRRQRAEILLAKGGELVEQPAKSLAVRVSELSEAVERVEGARISMLEDDPGARDPVRALAVNQMSDHIERTPGIGAFVRRRKAIGEAAHQRVDCRWRSRQDGD